MILVCLSLLLISLIYVGGSHRISTIIYVSGFQGLCLGTLVISEMDTSHWIGYSLTLVDTLMVKGFLLPMFYLNILKKHKTLNDKTSLIPDNLNLVMVTLATIGSVLLVNYIHPIRLSLEITHGDSAHGPNPLHLSVSLALILSGFILMLTRRKLFTMVLAFAIIENGIFLLTLSIGEEMSSLVHLRLLIDLLATILIIGLLFNRMAFAYKDIMEDNLNKLYD